MLKYKFFIYKVEGVWYIDSQKVIVLIAQNQSFAQ